MPTEFRAAPPVTFDRSLKLETLIRLRWFAVIGQTGAILGVYWGLAADLPLDLCLLAVAASAWLNIALRLRYPPNHRLSSVAAGLSLAWDVAQLAILLHLTGGLENPFSFLFLGPVLISATSQPPRATLLLGLFTVACASLIGLFHQPLPWEWMDDLRLPPLYLVGVYIALLICLLFIGMYVWQVAEEQRQFTDALTATELVLAREQHMNQLDGLAAAAAHELGTPLATIALVTKELAGVLPKDGPIGEDMTLLREQVQRCRDILAKLKSLSSEDAPFDTMSLAQILEEVVEPHRDFGVTITVDLPDKRDGERSSPAIPPSSTVSATSWRTPSISPAPRWSWRRAGTRRASPSPSSTTDRALPPTSSNGSASPTSRAAAARVAAATAREARARRRRPASASASSSPRRSCSGPAPGSTIATDRASRPAPWSR